ncbi:hypothetical protein [Gluconacetobacter diazotrophicus]|uniref:Uncharacterized protein n=1 Tax=Gluconacetobacter diazotrophicus TaxID=33996 RepID=A0A7W4I7I7_GLUDI|nr:hypothetical protein [Gluconacetobacter diazotrophicus]MBB2157654.1 hypothetical protein [Gluconacetobacter diazotrophicus]
MKSAVRLAAIVCCAALAGPGLSLAQGTQPPRIPPAANPHAAVPPERMGSTHSMLCASEMTPTQCVHPEKPGPPPEHAAPPGATPPSSEVPKKPSRPPSAPPPVTAPP